MSPADAIATATAILATWAATGEALAAGAKVCRCELPYVGAQMVGTPMTCETCWGVLPVREWAK